MNILFEEWGPSYIGGRWYQHIYISSNQLKIIKRVRRLHKDKVPIFIHTNHR